MKNTFEEQLNAVITEYKSALSRSQDSYTDGSGIISRSEIYEFQTRCISAIEKASGLYSIYSRRVMEIEKSNNHPWNHVAGQIGVAQGLLYDIQNGYLKSLEEIIHGDVFSDFLEMASHLVSQGYRDAAAVMAGSTLEIHLRKLCDKNDIETTKPNGEPKKNNLLNQELAKAGVYTKLEHKNVTASLGLRNHAAHGEYGEYNKEQVRNLIDGVRGFITRHPA